MNRIKEISSNEVDLYIYGDIGSNYWWSEDTDNSATGFLKDFHLCEAKYDKINIRLNSLGGSVYDGIPIANAISRSSKIVVCHNDGIAMSMAAIILISGKKTVLADNSITMFHSPWCACYGNSVELRKTADEMDVFNKSLAITTSNKMGKSVEDVINEIFDGQDHFFSSSDMIEKKLADSVVSSELAIPEQIKDLSISNVVARKKEVENAYRNIYNKAPGKLEKIFSKIRFKAKANINDLNNQEMDIKQVAVKLGMPEDSTEEQVLAKLDEIQASKESEKEGALDSNPKKDAPVNLSDEQVNKIADSVVAKVEKKLGVAAAIPPATKDSGNPPPKDFASMTYEEQSEYIYAQNQKK